MPPRRQARAGFVRISALERDGRRGARRKGGRAPGSGGPRRQASGRRDDDVLRHRLGDDRASRRRRHAGERAGSRDACGSRALRSLRAPGGSFRSPACAPWTRARAASSRPRCGPTRTASRCLPARTPSRAPSRPPASSRTRSRRSSPSAAKSPRRRCPSYLRAELDRRQRSRSDRLQGSSRARNSALADSGLCGQDRTRASSSIDVSPEATFATPSSQSDRMPLFAAERAISSRLACCTARAAISSDIRRNWKMPTRPL